MHTSSIRLYNLFLIFILCLSCNAQNPNGSQKAQSSEFHTKLDHVKSGLIDRIGHLWFGTSRQGIFRYDGKNFKNFSVTDGLPSNEVNCMLEDEKGNLWFGTNEGISKYNGASFENISMPSDNKNNLWGNVCNGNQVLSMIQDAKGDLWFGTCGSGAYRYDGTKFESFLAEEGRKQSDSLHHNVIKSMVSDTEGNIWFTSLTHGGVTKYDGKTMTYFTEKDGLKDDMIFAIFQDQVGTFWFGSIQNKEGGLYISDGKTFNHIELEDGICDNFIIGFFQDKRGLYWIRTGTSLCTYDGLNFKNFISKDGQSLNDIEVILEDKEGMMWFGGKYGQLWNYDGKRLIDHRHKLLME